MAANVHMNRHGIRLQNSDAISLPYIRTIQLILPSITKMNTHLLTGLKRRTTSQALLKQPSERFAFWLN